MENSIGFIGVGNIASAILGGLFKSVYITNDKISIFDTDSSKYSKFENKEINFCETLKELTEKSKFIFLTVKPQIYSTVILQLSEFLTDEHIIVTVAPGFTTEKIQNLIGNKNAKVIRTMPNTPLLLGKGATAVAENKKIDKSDFDFIKNIFSFAGTVEILPESKMDEIIAVSGSSPAYVFLFVKAIIDYAKSVGIDGNAALNLATATLEGASEMLKNSNMTPDELIAMVKSPKGTTEAALNELEKGKFYENLTDAMKACTSRAIELGNSN